MDKNYLKTQLFKHCFNDIDTRIKTVESAIADAQDAARSETKSVASEEPETGKERMQREVETLGRRLDELEAQHTILSNINYKKAHTHVEPGALVETSMGTFFISMSADEIDIEGESYCPISMSSPIGQVLKDKQAGEKVSFRGKVLEICHIY